MTQLNLFAAAAELPEGLVYRPEIVAPDEQEDLAGRLAALPFEAFQFHGFEGNRRTVSFGWRYAFDGSGLAPADPFPDWLLPIRDRAAALAGLAPEAFEHALVLEYPAGAGIGWHRDRPVFGDVVGVSLLAPARLRFRRKPAVSSVEGAGDKWQRAALVAEPGSAYLLRGPAREEWQHSIPAMEALRYSITLRTLRKRP